MTSLVRSNLRLTAVCATVVMAYLVLCGTPFVTAAHAAHGHSATHRHGALGCVVRDMDAVKDAPQLNHPVPVAVLPVVRWVLAEIVPPPRFWIVQPEEFLPPPVGTLHRQFVLLLI